MRCSSKFMKHVLVHLDPYLAFNLRHVLIKQRELYFVSFFYLVHNNLLHYIVFVVILLYIIALSMVYHGDKKMLLIVFDL